MKKKETLTLEEFYVFKSVLDELEKVKAQKQLVATTPQQQHEEALRHIRETEQFLARQIAKMFTVKAPDYLN